MYYTLFCLPLAGLPTNAPSNTEFIAFFRTLLNRTTQDPPLESSDYSLPVWALAVIIVVAIALFGVTIVAIIVCACVCTKGVCVLVCMCMCMCTCVRACVCVGDVCVSSVRFIILSSGYLV